MSCRHLDGVVGPTTVVDVLSRPRTGSKGAAFPVDGALQIGDSQLGERTTGAALRVFGGRLDGDQSDSYLPTGDETLIDADAPGREPTGRFCLFSRVAVPTGAHPGGADASFHRVLATHDPWFWYRPRPIGMRRRADCHVVPLEWQERRRRLKLLDSNPIATQKEN